MKTFREFIHTHISFAAVMIMCVLTACAGPPEVREKADTGDLHLTTVFGGGASTRGSTLNAVFVGTLSIDQAYFSVMEAYAFDWKKRDYKRVAPTVGPDLIIEQVVGDRYFAQVPLPQTIPPPLKVVPSARVTWKDKSLLIVRPDDRVRTFFAQSLTQFLFIDQRNVDFSIPFDPAKEVQNEIRITFYLGQAQQTIVASSASVTFSLVYPPESSLSALAQSCCQEQGKASDCLALPPIQYVNRSFLHLRKPENMLQWMPKSDGDLGSQCPRTLESLDPK